MINLKYYSKALSSILKVIVLLFMIPITSALAWDQALINAANAVGKNEYTKKQLAMVLARNYDINLLAMKGLISDKAFQVCHKKFEKISIEIGKKAAKSADVTFTVQVRDTSKAYKAGTDQDYITGATEPEQIKKMQKTYNEKFTKKLKELDPNIPDNTNWIKRNDIDFMADARYTSTTNFEEIAKLNNAAYTRTGSARYEAWSRSPGSGGRPDLKDSRDYMDEMQDMIHHRDELLDGYRKEFDDLTNKMMNVKEGTPAYESLKKRLEFLDVEIFKNQALQAKYMDRINVCTQNLKKWLPVDSPLRKVGSNLPAGFTGDIKAASGRKIFEEMNNLDSRAIGAMKKEIIQRQLQQHIEVLATIAETHPSLAGEMNSAIGKYASKLSTAQHAEIVEAIRKGLGQDAAESLAKVLRSSSINNSDELLKKLFKSMLPKQDIEKALKALESGNLDDLPQSAHSLRTKIFNLTGYKHTNLSGLSTSEILDKIGKHIGLENMTSDTKKILVQLIENMEETTDPKILKMVLGDGLSAKLLKIKRVMPNKMKASLAKRLASKIPLKTIDGKWTSLELGEDGLGTDTVMGIAMTYKDISDIMDKNLPPDEESRELQNAIVSNIPVVGDFLQSINKGIEAGFEGSWGKGAESAVYLIVGIGGVVPGAQIPALVAGLGMAGVQIGGIVWNAYWDRRLIEAWIRSGVWSKDGKLKNLKDMNGKDVAVSFDALVKNENTKYKFDYYNMTIRESILDYTEKRMLAGNALIKSFETAILQLYPDFDIHKAVREPRQRGEGLIRAAIKDAGDGKTLIPRGKERNAAIAIYRKYKQAVDAQTKNAIEYLKTQAQKEYQAQHFVGEALEIYQKLKALGDRLKLPLIERVNKSFSSFTGMVKKLGVSPFVVEGLALRKVQMMERYYAGYIKIESQLHGIENMFAMTGIKMPSHHLAGFLEIDAPRMDDLNITYMNRAIIPARKEVQKAYRRVTGKNDYIFNPYNADDCQLKLFRKLAGILVKKVECEDRKLLLQQWSGKLSLAKISRDKAMQDLERIQKNESVDILGVSLPTLKAFNHLGETCESAYAWANMQWEGSHVYNDALDMQIKRAEKLEKEYQKAKNTAELALKFCIRNQPKVILILSDKNPKVGDTVYVEAKKISGTLPKNVQWLWSTDGNIILKGNHLNTANLIVKGSGKIKVFLVRGNQILLRAEKKIELSSDIKNDTQTDDQNKTENAYPSNTSDTNESNNPTITEVEAGQADMTNGSNDSKNSDTQMGTSIGSTTMQGSRHDIAMPSNTNTAKTLSFSGTVLDIWKGGISKDSNGHKFHFERQKTEGGSAGGQCARKAHVTATVSGEIDPSFAPSTQKEILKELNDKANYYRRFPRTSGTGKPIIKPFSIGKFKGYLMETKLRYQNGGVDAGYVDSKANVYAKGWVIYNKHAVSVSYTVNSYGCFNNSQKEVQIAMAGLAKKEARAILDSLKIVEKGDFKRVPYTGPKPDGSDMLKVKLAVLPKRPSFLGETVEIGADVSGGKPPYSYRWSGDHAGKGAKVLFASRKAGDYSLSVVVTDAKGDSATDSVTIKVGAVDVSIIQVSPSAGSPIFPGVPIVFSAKVKNKNIPGDKLEILWQSTSTHNVSFNPNDKKSFKTNATFPTTGIYKIWAEIYLREGKTATTVGESKQLKVEVLSPKLSLSSNIRIPYVGEKVIIKVQEDPKIKDELISFWWEIKGGRTLGAGPEANSPNDRIYSFIPKDTNPVTVTVHAKAKDGGAELGKKSITMIAKKYKVSVSKPKRLDKAPWKWDIKQGKAVELPQAIAVFQNAETHATITPKPKGKARYRWSVDKKGCVISAPESKSTNLNASKKGTYQITVKATDKNGIELGKGTTSFTVTVSQHDLDEAAQKTKDQEKAKALLSEARKLWKEGKLQQAIYKTAQAQKLSEKDKKIAKILIMMQKQKKVLDSQLEKAVRLIDKNKLEKAEKVLAGAARISDKYKKYKEVLKKWSDARKKEEKKKKQLNKNLEEAKAFHSVGKLDEAVRILKKGSRQFPGNEEIDRLLKKIQKQQNDARKKMAEGQNQWKDGMLDQAALILKEAVTIDPSNKQIAKVLKDMQRQKKIIDNALKKADLLISQKKFRQAENILVKAGYISRTYPPYHEMTNRLAKARAAIESTGMPSAAKPPVKHVTVNTGNNSGTVNSTQSQIPATAKPNNISGGAYVLVDIKSKEHVRKPDNWYHGKITEAGPTSTQINYWEQNMMYKGILEVQTLHAWDAPPAVIYPDREIVNHISLKFKLSRVDDVHRCGFAAKTAIRIDTDRGGPLYSLSVGFGKSMSDPFPVKHVFKDTARWKIKPGAKKLYVKIHATSSYGGYLTRDVAYVYEWQENPKPGSVKLPGKQDTSSASQMLPEEEPVDNTTGVTDEDSGYDAKNRVVRIPDNPSLRAKQALSISFWAYFNKIPRTGNYADSMAVLEKDKDYLLYWRADKAVLEIAFADARDKLYHIGANTRLSGVKVKEWHHFAVTSVNPVGKNKAETHFYIDGVEQPVSPNVNRPCVKYGWFTGNTGTLYIGSRSPDNAAQLPFFGSISQVKILQRVLSSAEIKSIYKAGNSGRE